MLRSSEDFWQCCQKWQLTVLGIPTAYWHQLASELTPDTLPILSKIKLIVIGGEAIQPAKVQQWQTVTGQYSPLPRLLNGYGPTEATIAATLSEFTSPTITNIPIGRPISNTQVYILDAFLQPVPVGVAGELHIGGMGESNALEYLVKAAKNVPDVAFVLVGDGANKAQLVKCSRDDFMC